MTVLYPDTQFRRISLLLQGALALFEETSPDILALLDNQENQSLMEAFELLGSALCWMQQEIKNPERSAKHSGL